MRKWFFSLLQPCVAACAVQAEESPDAGSTGGVDLRDAKMIAQGMELLNKACGGYCHGSNGEVSRRLRLASAWT